MTKSRSAQDFAAVYSSNKQGIGISIDNYIHLKEETVPGTAVMPSIGSQGSSTSAAAPSTDISAETDTNFRISVDGGAVLTVTIVPTGKTSGTLIAAELETKINAALSAAGQDGRVWVAFAGSLYVIKSQKYGVTSAVVITDGLTLNIADALKIGVPQTGVEAVGSAGGDFLFMTKAGLKVNQPFEMSEHKSGRQATNIIKKKIVAEGDIEMYVNMATGGSATVDTPVSTLLEAVLGKKTVVGSTIKFDSAQAPSKYMTIMQGNNMMGRLFNGAYPKSMTISMPGDGEAKISLPMKARNGKYASIAQVNGATVASTSVVVNVGESPRFEFDSHVMNVGADGRTVLDGADGSLKVVSRTDGTDTVVLNAAISAEDNGFLVPWLPHVFDQHGTDNPVTGLQGSVSFDNGSTVVEEIRSVELSFDHKDEDQDNWYGFDTNMGFVIGDRAEIMCKVEMLMSASQMSKIVQAKEFSTFAMKILLGPSTGRYMQFDMPKVYFPVPDLEIPDNGSVVVTLEGKCVQSAIGMLDAFSMTYK